MKSMILTALVLSAASYAHAVPVCTTGELLKVNDVASRYEIGEVSAAEYAQARLALYKAEKACGAIILAEYCAAAPLALRVFEVRYLDMVRKCQRAGAPFGVVALASGREVRQAGAPQEQFHDVGTLATIAQLQSPQPGLVTLSAHGTLRFRVRQSHQLPHGLWVADVEQMDADTF